MKKTSAKKSSPFHPCRLITLDESQYEIYLSGKIDICSPDGELIDGIGKLISDKVTEIRKKAAEEKREFAIDNLRLIEDLIRSCGDRPIELSNYGAIGMANALMHAQEMIGR